jgi:hypothetical protein
MYKWAHSDLLLEQVHLLHLCHFLTTQVFSINYGIDKSRYEQWLLSFYKLNGNFLYMSEKTSF